MPWDLPYDFLTDVKGNSNMYKNETDQETCATVQMKPGTLTASINRDIEDVDIEMRRLGQRLEGLRALKAKLEGMPGVQDILDLLTQHNLR